MKKKIQDWFYWFAKMFILIFSIVLFIACMVCPFALVAAYDSGWYLLLYIITLPICLATIMVS